MKYSLLLGLALLFPTSLFAKSLTFKQIETGVCRITATDTETFRTLTKRGTGTVVAKKNGFYYIMTNGHVASEEGSTVTIEFFKNGYISYPLYGKVVWRYFIKRTSIDMALITLPVESVKGFSPTVIPFAPQAFVLRNQAMIRGAGCPEGGWLQYWNTRAVPDRDNQNVLNFPMPPVGGQSGSAILTDIADKSGELHTRIVGMITWKIGSSGRTYGGGLSLHRLYDLLDGDGEEDTIVYQVVSNGCDKCGKHKNEHLYVYKGNKESDNHFGQLYCPKSLPILKRGEYFKSYQDCFPFGRKPRPEPPNTKPGLPPFGQDGNKPPNIFPNDPTPTDPPKDDTKLLDRIKVLEAELLRLKGINDGLDAERKKYSDKIAMLEKLKDSLKTDKSDLEDDKLQLVGNIANLEEENKEHKSFIEKLLNKINLPFLENFGIQNSGLGTFLVVVMGLITSGTLTTFLWNRLVLPRIMEKTGRLPAFLAKRIFSGKIKDIDEHIKEKLGEKLGKIEQFIAPKTVSPSDPVWDHDTYTFTESTPPSIVKYVSEPQSHVTINNNQNSYVSDLFAQNGGTLNGHTMQQWSFKSGLYQEAIKLLRQDQLPYNQGELHNQDKAAQAIDMWVKDQFFKRYYNEPTGDINELEAYKGFLYSKALIKLQQNEFNVLNHIEIANAVDIWVKEEFFKINPRR